MFDGTADSIAASDVRSRAVGRLLPNKLLITVIEAAGIGSVLKAWVRVIPAGDYRLTGYNPGVAMYRRRSVAGSMRNR